MKMVESEKGIAKMMGSDEGVVGEDHHEPHRLRGQHRSAPPRAPPAQVVAAAICVDLRAPVQTVPNVRFQGSQVVPKVVLK
jgi:hypothetical protein